MYLAQQENDDNVDSREGTTGDSATRTYTFSREDLSGHQWVQLTLRQQPTEPLELFIGLTLVIWGLWIMLPWWNVTALNPSTYRLLLLVVRDEFILGALNWSLGSSMLWSCYLDRVRSRYLCSVWLTSITGVYCALFLFSDYRSPAFLWWLVYVLAGWWLITRTKERMYALASQKRKG